MAGCSRIRSAIWTKVGGYITFKAKFLCGCLSGGLAKANFLLYMIPPGTSKCPSNDAGGDLGGGQRRFQAVSESPLNPRYCIFNSLCESLP